MTRGPATRCKVCGEQGELLCETTNEHSATSPLHHHRCGGCGLVFVGDAIDSEELGIAYASLDETAYYEEVKVENGRKMDASVADLLEMSDRTRPIIDIGTGNGRFLEVLRESGFEHVAGHEIPGADLRRFKDAGVTIYQDYDYASIPDASFDAVTLLDVVEHVPDPHRLFQACSRILRPGGLVYFHTPAVTRVDRLMHALQGLPLVAGIGRVWQRGRTSVFHLQNYSGASLRKVLEDSGFGGIELQMRNELSWPVQRYVRVYVCEKQGLPSFLAPVLTPLFYPLLATDFFNSNKFIAWARKA